MTRIGSFGKNQTIVFRGINLPDLGYEGQLSQEIENDVTLYVVCEDYHERRNELSPFKINLCVTPRDFQPVVLNNLGRQTIPLAFDATSYDLSFEINEAAECRWDTRSNLRFSEMPAQNSCNAVQISGGYSCNFGSIPISVPTTKLCVKCLDHPEWKGTSREGERNENQQCASFEIVKSPSALSAEIVNPVNGFLKKIGAGITSIEVFVRTNGGANSGNADCFINIDGTGEQPFKQTGGKEHKMTFNQLTAGEHEMKIVCRDGVNPRVTLNSKFTIETENTIPKVSRIFSSDGKLIIVTDEPAECAYTFDKVEGRNSACNFKVEEASSLSGVYLMGIVLGSEGLRHETQIQHGQIYYMKCKDIYGNEDSGCGIIASPGTY